MVGVSVLVGFSRGLGVGERYKGFFGNWFFYRFLVFLSRGDFRGRGGFEFGCRVVGVMFLVLFGYRVL